MFRYLYPHSDPMGGLARGQPMRLKKLKGGKPIAVLTVSLLNRRMRAASAMIAADPFLNFLHTLNSCQSLQHKLPYSTSREQV